MTVSSAGAQMKSSRTPLLILAVLMAVMLGLLFFEAARLPETVATHFDGAGRPNGWMKRSSHLIFSAVFGFTFPLLPLALSLAAFRLPARFINLPHRDYWLAPERRPETHRWLVRQMLWLACLLATLHVMIQGLIVAANAQTPPHLATPMVLVLLGGFLAGLATWLMILWRRFSTVPH